jgi:MFS family permease
MSLGALMNLVAIAFFIRGDGTIVQFAFLFLIGFIAAVSSLFFLRKMPDAPPSTVSRTSEPVPWRVMLGYEPFRRIVIYCVTIHVAFAGMSFLWVPMSKSMFNFSDAQILLLGASGSGAAMLALMLMGSMIDRVGSRPLLLFSLIIIVLHLCGWGLLAGGWLPLNLWTIALQQITAGFAAPLFSLANSRSLMATIPQMGRSHFFAIYTVITSLILGIMPVFWGLLLDTLEQFQPLFFGFSFSAYALIYFVMAGIGLVAFIQALKTEEKQSITTEDFLRELFIKTPARALSRIFTRRSLP